MRQRDVDPMGAEAAASPCRAAGVVVIRAIASEAKQSITQYRRWIASSQRLLSGAHARDSLAPLRKHFAFVAGNDGNDYRRR
jgi:hypothetical protein